jgi:hypothetical protein
MHGFVCLCESFFKKNVLKILEKGLNFKKSLKFQKFENEFEKILKKKKKTPKPQPSLSLSFFFPRPSLRPSSSQRPASLPFSLFSDAHAQATSPTSASGPFVPCGPAPPSLLLSHRPAWPACQGYPLPPVSPSLPLF